MDDLDFSGLTDDQLVGLLRSALQEAVRRHPGVEAAARAAVLDEAEKARIFQAATEREAAAMRARERERVAAEATARVRAEQAASRAEADAVRERSIRESQAAEARAKAEAQARADVAASLSRDATRRKWLMRASELVGLPPGKISINVYKWKSEGSPSVYINPGSDKYEKDHLCSYRGLELSTKRHLMGRKPGLLVLCAELRASYNEVHIDGSQYFSETEAAS